MNATLPPRHARDDGSDAWRHVGEVINNQVRVVGLRSVAFNLSRAAETIGDEALAALADADAIRRRLGLSWRQVVAGDDALAREAA